MIEVGADEPAVGWEQTRPHTGAAAVSSGGRENPRPLRKDAEGVHHHPRLSVGRHREVPDPSLGLMHGDLTQDHSDLHVDVVRYLLTLRSSGARVVRQLKAAGDDVSSFCEACFTNAGKSPLKSRFTTSPLTLIVMRPLLT